MYSIGYIGYYGISLMCASYTVLFVSIAAHALQFAFLAYVETPRKVFYAKKNRPPCTYLFIFFLDIEKTYNPQPALTRHKFETLDTTASRDFYTNYFRRDLIAFKNFDMFRSTDYAAGMVILYSIVTPMFSSRGVTIAVVQAFIWRLIHSLGTGGLLAAQSNNKYITRHFIKWGGGVQEAFQNWKSIYNLSLCMTYVTFFVACWKTYTLPDNWTYGMTLLRHTLGLMFISLHIWTSVSIYEVLGDFGW